MDADVVFWRTHPLDIRDFAKDLKSRGGQQKIACRMASRLTESPAFGGFTAKQWGGFLPALFRNRRNPLSFQERAYLLGDAALRDSHVNAIYSPDQAEKLFEAALLLEFCDEEAVRLWKEARKETTFACTSGRTPTSANSVSPPLTVGRSLSLSAKPVPRYGIRASASRSPSRFPQLNVSRPGSSSFSGSVVHKAKDDMKVTHKSRTRSASPGRKAATG